MRLMPEAGVNRLCFREAAFAGVAIALCIVMVLFGVDAQSRLTHPLWLDECITALIANDDSLAHMLHAIRGEQRTTHRHSISSSGQPRVCLAASGPSGFVCSPGRAWWSPWSAFIA